MQISEELGLSTFALDLPFVVIWRQKKKLNQDSKWVCNCKQIVTVNKIWNMAKSNICGGLFALIQAKLTMQGTCVKPQVMRFHSMTPCLNELFWGLHLHTLTPPHRSHRNVTQNYAKCAPAQLYNMPVSEKTCFSQKYLKYICMVRKIFAIRNVFLFGWLTNGLLLESTSLSRSKPLLRGPEKTFGDLWIYIHNMLLTH